MFYIQATGIKVLIFSQATLLYCKGEIPVFYYLFNTYSFDFCQRLKLLKKTPKLFSGFDFHQSQTYMNNVESTLDPI